MTIIYAKIYLENMRICKNKKYCSIIYALLQHLLMLLFLVKIVIIL